MGTWSLIVSVSFWACSIPACSCIPWCPSLCNQGLLTNTSRAFYSVSRASPQVPSIWWRSVVPFCRSGLWCRSAVSVCGAGLRCWSAVLVCGAGLWGPVFGDVCGAGLWCQSLVPSVVSSVPLWCQSVVSSVVPVCGAVCSVSLLSRSVLLVCGASLWCQSAVPVCGAGLRCRSVVVLILI